MIQKVKTDSAFDNLWENVFHIYINTSTSLGLPILDNQNFNLHDPSGKPRGCTCENYTVKCA